MGAVNKVVGIMKTTLKENYSNKKLSEIKTKAGKADALLNENNVDYHVRLLIEALDENEYKEATEVIEKLQKINDAAKSAGMDLLSGAINTIVKEINSFTGGGGLTRFKGRLSSLFSKTPAKNPILAGLAMVGTLEAGFKVLPTVLKNNIPDIETNKEKQNMPLEDLIKDDDKLKKNVESTLVKAFVPTGTFGKIFGKVPGIDTQKLVVDLLGATPAGLGEISKILAGGTSVADIDPNLANPKEAGSGETTGKEATTELSPKEQKAQLVAVQNAAKDAGITEEETVTRFLSNVMGWKEGIKHPYSDTALQVLKDYAYNKAKIAKGQLDGFVDGIAIDQEKVKSEIDTLVKSAEEKKKKEEEAKVAAGKGTGQGQVSAAG